MVFAFAVAFQFLAIFAIPAIMAIS